MPLTFTAHGEYFGGRVDDIALALCGDDLSRLYAVISAGYQIHYYIWEWSGNEFSLAIDKKSAVGGSGVAAASTAEDRVLAAFRSGPKYCFRCMDGSLNNHPDLDEAEVPGPSYISVALAAIPRPDHLLWPGGSQLTRGGQVQIKTKVNLKIGPKIAYAAAAEVALDHSLRVGLWMMDWHGQVRTHLGQAVVTTTESVIFADVATINAVWEKDVLKKAEFVTALQTAGPSGPLKLIRWRKDSTGIAQVSANVTGDQVKAVTIVPLETGASPAAATAVIDSEGHLKVIGWKFAADGSITRGAETTAEAVSMVRSAWVRDRDIVTAVKLATGSLKLIYWRFPETGAAIRLGEKAIHQGPALDVVHRPGTGNDLGETIVATSVSGDVKLLRFGVQQS